MLQNQTFITLFSDKQPPPVHTLS